MFETVDVDARGAACRRRECEGGVTWSDDHRAMAHHFHVLVQRGTSLDDATLAS
ncbi:MAG: hypothetical protein SFX73_34410 [Kofleriaceae bacterium]|nr:hypothetical protein [Kofleriaceae bacterium]